MTGRKRRKTRSTPVNLPDRRQRPQWLQWTPANPALRVAAFAAWAAVLTAVVIPIHLPVDLPMAGQIARHDYKAVREFSVEFDNPHYEQEQSARVRAVLPVYAYRPDLGEQKARKIEELFEKGRKLLDELDGQRRAVEEEYDEKLRDLDARIETLTEIYRTALTQLEGPEDAERVRKLENELAKLRLRRERVATQRQRALERLPAQRQRALADFEATFREELGLGDAFDHEAFEVLVQARFARRVAALAAQAVREALRERRVVRDLASEESRMQDGYVERTGAEQKRCGLEAVGRLESLDDVRRDVARAVAKVAAAATPPLDPKLVDAVVRLARLSVEPTLVYDRRATLRARERALRGVHKTITHEFKPGETIVRAGERVTPRDVAILRAMHDQGAPGYFGLRAVATFLLVVAGSLALLGFARLWPGEVIHRRRDYVLIALTVLFEALVLRGGVALGTTLAASHTGVPLHALLYGLPVAMGSMLLRVFLRSEAAVVVAVLDAVLAGVILWFQGGVVGQLRAEIVVYALLSGLAGVFAMREIRQRTNLVRAGVVVGLFNILVACALDLGRPDFEWGDLGFVAGSALTGGLLDYLLIMAIAPMLEWILGYASDIKLLELANLNSPLLRKLAMETPGTYHHSMMVGNLAEQAAAAIGAHALLARVGAYYHDIGKTHSPLYFAENQRGSNPHDRLQPRVSAMIIRDHVTYGIELAHRHKLPSEIIAFIPEHHGTSLIAYFYARACEHEGKARCAVNEADFRYPGPKPQSKETAIVMLADSVEATVRSMGAPNPARIGAIVEDLVRKRIADGQLDESNLTFRDVDIIIRTFTRVLASMYHARPEYPPLPPGVAQPDRPDARRATQPVMRATGGSATSSVEADEDDTPTRPDLPAHRVGQRQAAPKKRGGR